MKYNGKKRKNILNGCIMNKLIKTYIFSISFFVVITANLFSQESYIKDRWDVKIGYTKPIQYQDYSIYFGEFIQRQGNTVVEANYGLTECFTIGAYIGHSRIYTTPRDYIPYIGSLVYYQTPFLGIKSNWHIFPLFIKHNDFRFDLYLTAKAGAYYLKDFFFEYNAGLGFAFYPWKHLGIYAEYAYGKLWLVNYQFRAGFVIKFNQ